jgi:TRAP-type C4-dicarboxylate transport system substrate-binding protein
MYKKWSILIVITVLILGLLLAACGTPATTTVTTATTATTTTIATTATTATTTAQTITLRFGYPMPRSGTALDMENYFNGISEKTEGRLKFQYYPAGTLYITSDAVTAVKKGLTDIATVTPEVLATIFPATQVAYLPGLNYPYTVEGQIAASRALPVLAAKFPVIQNEWKDFKVLFYQSSPGNILYSAKKEILVPSDLKGLKIGGIGVTMDICPLLGAVGVLARPPDAPQGLQTGVYEAYSTNYAVGLALRLYEVSKYVNEYSFGGGGWLVAMNWDTWNKISPADQKLIMDTVGDLNKAIQETQIKSISLFKEAFQKAGGKVNVPGPEWNTTADPVWNNWKTKAAAAGVPNPDEILAFWKQMRDDYVNKNIMP